MNFASKYVYASETPEYEYVSDDEFDFGMQVSDSSGSEDDDDEDEEKEAGKAGRKSKTPKDAHVGGEDIYEALSGPDTEAVYDDACDCIEEVPRAPKPKPKSKKPFTPKWQFQAYSRDPPPAPSQSRRSNARRFRRADTNVVSIKLNELVAPSNMHAGDPVHCSQCKAILSKLSKVVSDGTDKVWQCDFCGERNLVDVEDEEIPNMEDVTFLVEPAPATAATGPSGLDESLVIFCVDVSGSMCVTTEVPGRINLRGSVSRMRKLQSLNDTREDQHLPGQRRNVTYVSRLQAMQAAVDHQLQEMQKEHPNRRVGLITFDSEVTIVGDGTCDETTVVGDKLTNQDALVELGTQLNLPKPIKDSRNSLGDKLFSLEEGGATALGPALVVAVSMASRHAGSKVIICTDGMANVGLGKLDGPSTVTQTDTTTETFYHTVGARAMEKGISISVVTIKGTDTKLVELGKLADRTNGQVNIVDPLKLTQEFSTILADRIIATNVVATFILHKQLYIHNIDEQDKRESLAVREVGNVTCDTEVTFEYAMRPDKKETKSSSQNEKDTDTSVDNTASAGAEGAGAVAPTSSEHTESPADTQTSVPDELPFQLQIHYTDAEGMKALRVLTQTRPVTHNRDLAEENIDLNVLGTHAAQKTANLAMQGEYTMSRGTAFMNHRLAWRAAQKPEGGKNKKAWYRKIFSKIQSVENHVNRAQSSERVRLGGSTYSDEEDDDMSEELSRSMVMKKKSKKSQNRSSEVADTMAREVYYQAKMTSNKFD